MNRNLKNKVNPLNGLSAPEYNYGFLACTLSGAACDEADPVAKAAMQLAAEDYERRARQQELAKNAMAVFRLRNDASPRELRDARAKQAVHWRGRFYIPLALHGHCVLPSNLLRSSLFAATTRREEFESADLPVAGRHHLRVTGPRLNGYDRKVFAACVNKYQDRPLAQADDDWIKISLFELTKAVGIQPGPSVYQAISQSLDRLCAVQLEAHISGARVNWERLIRVRAIEGTSIKAVEIQIHESIAIFFKRGQWISLPVKILQKCTGLTGWLVCFLRTHSAPYSMEHTYLKEISGSTCSTAEFRRRLKQSIATLQSDRTPESVSISDVAWEKNCLAVVLSRWRIADPTGALAFALDWRAQAGRSA